MWKQLARAGGAAPGAGGLHAAPAVPYTQLPESLLELPPVLGSCAAAAGHAEAPKPPRRSSRHARQQEQAALLQALHAAAEWDYDRPLASAQRQQQQQQQQSSPVQLLDGICWAVTQPPEEAGFGRGCGSRHGGMSQLAGLATQVAAGWTQLGSQEQLEAGSQALEQQVFRGRSITLLLPVSADPASGVASKTVWLGAEGGEGELSCGQLLQHVFDFYQQQVEAQELLELLRRDGSVRAAVRPLVEAGREVSRGDLLGPCCALENVARVGPAGSSMYQLQLGQ